MQLKEKFWQSKLLSNTHFILIKEYVPSAQKIRYNCDVVEGIFEILYSLSTAFYIKMYLTLIKMSLIVFPHEITIKLR